MPSFNFEGASNFAITGGNFGKIEGRALIYNFPHSPRQQQSDRFPLRDPGVTPASFHPDRSEGRQRRLARHESTQQPLALPSAGIESITSTSGLTDVPAPRSSAPAASGQAGDPNVSTPPSVTDSEAPEGRDNSNQSTSVSRPSTPPSDLEEYQHIGPANSTRSMFSPRPLQSSDRASFAPLTESFGLSRLTLADQPQSASPVYGTTRPRYPNIPPNRSSTYPGTSTYRPQAPSSPILPRPSSADPFRPQRRYTQSPSTVNHKTFNTPLHVPTAPVEFELEDPATRFARLQSQRDTKGYAPTAPLPNVTLRSPHWTYRSICRWCHGVQPEDGLDGFCTESSSVPMPESRLCRDGKVRNYPQPPLPFIPASAQPQYNHPNTMLWVPRAPEQEYRSNGSHDWLEFGQDYGQVLYSSGRPSFLCSSF